MTVGVRSLLLLAHRFGAQFHFLRGHRKQFRIVESARLRSLCIFLCCFDLSKPSTFTCIIPIRALRRQKIGFRPPARCTPAVDESRSPRPWTAYI